MSPGSTSTLKSASPLAEPPAPVQALTRTEAELRADPEFQAQLAADTQAERLRTGRVASLLVVVLMPPGVLLDWLGYRDPPLLGYFLFLRLSCSVLAAGLLALHYTELGRRRVRWLGPPIALLPSYFMSVMILYEGGFASTYYAGINLVLLAVSAVVHWDLWESLLTTLAIIGLYTGACLLAPEQAAGGATFANYYFLGLTGVIVVTGNTVYNKLRWKEFCSRFELRRSRQLLEQSYQQLRDLDEMKVRFFANISHELRTPLTLLLSPLEELREHPRLREDPRLAEYLGTMQDNGMKLLKLINDLLDLVRLDAGRLVLHRRWIDVTSFAGGLINAIRHFAADRGLRTLWQVEPELARIWADPDKLEKVLLNLLFNSVKFTPAGGQITLRARAEAGAVVFEVEDTGVGIAPEHIDHLFRRFWQADSSARRKYQGAGLGLALVKELAEAHGGTVEARSTLGQGTTITVRLPILNPPENAPAEANPAPPGEGAGNGADSESWLASLYRRAELFASITPLRTSLRPWQPEAQRGQPTLILADDEPDLRRFLRSQLEEDYKVIEAVDGAQATSLARQYLPDLLLCDMMMPEKDGLQVCQELRAAAPTRNLPILLLTARADDETKLRCLAAGASDFLAKPFSSAELRLRLKNLVDARRLEKELARQNQRLQASLEQIQEQELQLVQAEKLASLGRLSAGIIHEINNPLNFVRTGLFVLSRQAPKLPEPDQPGYLDTVHDLQEGVSRVVEIVSDLRAFTHPQSGDRIEEVDVGGALEAALRFLAGEWREKVRILNELPAGFTVTGARTRLVQVFLNLLQNSLDALRHKTFPPGQEPTVRIQAQQVGGGRLIRVWDNGPGIPAEHLGKVFDPFFTTKEVGQGTGLGLSICYRLLAQVGGRISVQSRPGQDCEFTLEFPENVRETPGALGPQTALPA